MLLRWLNKQRFDASRPASGRLPARSGLDWERRYRPNYDKSMARLGAKEERIDLDELRPEGEW